MATNNILHLLSTVTDDGLPDLENSTMTGLFNMTAPPSSTSTASNANSSVHNWERIQIEKTLFIVIIGVVSVTAVPPNLLVLVLATTRVGCKSKSQGMRSTNRSGESTCLFVNKCVAHLLMCLTAPMDIVFMQLDGAGTTFCVTFLSVKSTLLLHVIQAVVLLGLDKVHRVHSINKPFSKGSVKYKILAVGVTLLISVFPTIVHVALSPDVLKKGCMVEPTVVDVAESVFLVAFVVNMVSMCVCVLLLCKHGKKVLSRDEDLGTITSTGHSSRNGLPLPGHSSFISPSEGIFDTASDVSSIALVDRFPNGQAKKSASGVMKRNDSSFWKRKMDDKLREETMFNEKDEANDTIINSHPSKHHIVLNGHATDSATGTTSTTTSSTRLNFFLVEEELKNQANKDNYVQMDQLELPPSHPANARKWVSPRDNVAPVTTAQGPADTGTASTANGLSAKVGPSTESRTGTCMQKKGSTISLPAIRKSSTEQTLSHASSKANSVTANRLRNATFTAARRGIFMMVLLLVCYLPLMIGILVLTSKDVLYETMLLVEGMTLPMAYAHALVDPLLAIKFNQQWRQRTKNILLCGRRKSRSTRSATAAKPAAAASVHQK